MSRRRQSRKEQRREALERPDTRRARMESDEVRAAKPVHPLNEFQADLFAEIKESQVVFVDAPAGCGKTFVIMSHVIDQLKTNRIKKIILSRPSVGMGRSLGLLPGTMKEKFEPYLMPLIDVIKQRYGHGFYECQVGNGNIEFVPLEYLRGRSFNDSIIIVDEFQNTKPDEAYSIMTRLGETSKLYCLGDSEQHDMGGQNGLDWSIGFVDRHNLDGFAAVVEGTSDDIVRSGFCKAVVKAMEVENENKGK
ncbi:Phosphate starvation-inducible protein [Salmonella phage pSal-SNUABM-01]|nr:Phosphate starvation-inducible protein [Salmonella phage pSal-SNUABM-01]